MGERNISYLESPHLRTSKKKDLKPLKDIKQKKSFNSKIMMLESLKQEEMGYNIEKSAYLTSNPSEENINVRLKPMIEELVKKEVASEMKGVIEGMKKYDNNISSFYFFYSFSAILITMFVILLVFQILPIIPGIVGVLFSVGVLLSVRKGEKNLRFESYDATNPKSN